MFDTSEAIILGSKTISFFFISQFSPNQFSAFSLYLERRKIFDASST